MKFAMYCLILIFAIFLQIGLVERYLGGLHLSLITPLILFGFLIFPLEEMLVVAVAAGFILDVATLSRTLLATMFLPVEIFLLYLSRRVVNLRSRLSVFLALLVLIWSYSLTRFLIAGQMELSIKLAIISLAGAVWAAIFYLIYYFLAQVGLWQKE